MPASVAAKLPQAVDANGRPDLARDYGHYCRPGLIHLLHAISLDAVYERAEGDRLWRRQGDELVEVLDLVGGYGANLFGHYHPELVAEQRRLLEAQVPILAQGSCRGGAAQLARALCERLGDYVVIFSNSGTETVEAAIKHVYLERKKTLFWAVRHAFHGKTLGAIQFTDSYREPFDCFGPQVRFLDLDDPATWAAAEMESDQVAAVFIEPILGEGGVRPLPDNFIQWLNRVQREHGIPLVADEVQTGGGRTGAFLASTAAGLDPDYVCLSKGLGGGMEKIGALLIKRSRFVEEFSIKHTSTFAEDDRGCLMALKTLEILDRDDLPSRCVELGEYLKDRLEEVRKLYPGQIKEVRGKGLMIGLELQDLSDSPSNSLRMLSDQQYLGYLASAYLLNVHRIRVAPTLSQPFTIRIEPSAYISRADLDRFVDAVVLLVQALRAADVPHLTAFQVGAPSRAIVDYRPVFRPNREAARTPRRVAFIGHLMKPEHATLWDPSLRGLKKSDLEAYMARPSRVFGGSIFDQINVRSRTGEEVHLSYIGLDITPRQVMDALRQRDTGWVLEKVDDAVALARDAGCQVVGLGGYTSIVSGNCRRIKTEGIALTSGNSLTVGMGIEALRQAAQEQGINLAQSRLAVIGAAGNIGLTYAIMMAPQVKELVLLVRDRHAPRLQAALAEIQKAAPGANISVSDDPSSLRTCSIIAAASNVPEPLIYPEYLAPDPVVICDISLPSDVADEVHEQRPDVCVIEGGLVRLPHNEDFWIAGLDLQPGHVYACLAETLLMGLEGKSTHGSYGLVTQQGVEEALAMAAKHGFALGEFKAKEPAYADLSTGSRPAGPEKHRHDPALEIL